MTLSKGNGDIVNSYLGVLDNLIYIKRHNTVANCDMFRVCGKLPDRTRKTIHIGEIDLRVKGYKLIEHIHAIRVIKKPNIFGYYTVLISLKKNPHVSYKITMDNFPNSLNVILSLLENFILLSIELDRLKELMKVAKIESPLDFLYLCGCKTIYRTCLSVSTLRNGVNHITRNLFIDISDTLTELGLLKKVTGKPFLYQRTVTADQISAIADKYRNWL